MEILKDFFTNFLYYRIQNIANYIICSKITNFNH